MNPVKDAPVQSGLATQALESTRSSSGLPFALVLGLVSGIAVYLTSVTSLRDIDLYWHLLAGWELLSGASASSIGTDWSFAPDPLPWTSTQSAAEVLLAAIHDASGWAGVAAYRVVTAALALAALAWSTLRNRPKALAGFPYLLALVMVAFVSQDRPQQFTLMGACLLGGVLVTGLVDRELPKWWLILPATAVWSNLHGGWVLVPFVLSLVSLGILVDTGIRTRQAWTGFLLSGLAFGAGYLTPAGTVGLTAALRLSKATGVIAEWEAIQPAYGFGWLTVAMLGVILIGWVASESLPRSEAVVVLLLLAFTWLAWRNLAPGLALLAPLAAHRLSRGFPAVGRPEPGWSAPLGIIAALVLTVAGLVNVSTKTNLPTDTEPIGLARAIATLPPGQRVLNDYNTSGIVLYFGGNGTRVAVDGRFDRYGAEYIEDYMSMMWLKGEWARLLDSLAPTSALLKADSALAYVLSEVRGWTVVQEENDYVLLVPPPE